MTYEEFLIYARIKCGGDFPESALSFANQKLRGIKTLTLEEASFFLSIKFLLEKETLSGGKHEADTGHKHSLNL